MRLIDGEELLALMIRHRIGVRGAVAASAGQDAVMQPGNRNWKRSLES